MPKIIAHRANILNLPENSKEAIEECINQKVDGIEIDIRHTKDGEAIVFHDEDLSRLCVVKNKTAKLNSRIKDVELNDLLKNYRLQKNLMIPSLKEVLSLLQSYSGYCFLELKDEATNSTLDLIKEHFKDNIPKLRIISFDHKQLLKLKKDSFFKQVKMLSLDEVPRLSKITKPVSGLDGINTNVLYPFQTEILKLMGKEVGLWWLADQIPFALIKGIFKRCDFITTDNYHKTKKLLKSHS